MNNVVIEFMKLVHPEYDEVPTSINSEDIHTHLRDATELIQEATKLIQELKAENERLKNLFRDLRKHSGKELDPEKLLAEIERLKKVIDEYARHKDGCAVYIYRHNFTINDCDCGFEQALKGTK